MLSVARRGDEGAKDLDSEWRGGGGGGGGRVGRMEEENELEEGEAYSLQEEEEEENESCIDPDSLSYIDEKLQNVLGHFQKDFEGGVFAENLGAKYGGYGSFLPTYQRSPSILTQPSPPKLPNQNSVKSPCNLSFEGTRQNASFTPSAPVTKNNATSTSLLNNSVETDMYTSMPDDQDSQNTFINKQSNSSDLKTLKVRIKVGPNNNLTRNNAAIYSGLGLDISPTSSFEESPDGSGGFSPESRDLRDFPDESPNTILQVMTCFSVPGGFLHSPLQDNIFQLAEREILLLKKGKKGTIHKDLLGKETIWENIVLPTREKDGRVEKNGKSCDKKGWSKEKQNQKGDVDIGTILNREIDIETPAGQELLSNALNIPLLCGMNDDEKSQRHMASNVEKSVTKMKDISKIPIKGSAKDVYMSPVPANDKQLKLTERNTPSGANHLDNEHSRGCSNAKENLLERMMKTRDVNDQADPSCNLQRDGQMKIEKDCDTYHMNDHSNGYKGRNEQTAEPLDKVKKISSHKVTSLEADREKVLQVHDQTCDRKRKVKVGRSDSEPFRELSKSSSSGNSSVAAKELRTMVDCVEKKVKVPKPRKQSAGITGNVHTEHLENGASYMDSNVNGKQKSVKAECDKTIIRCTQTLEEKLSRKRVENNLVSGVPLADPIATSLTCDSLPTYATMPPQAPVVIEEHWVCCDKCHKWRLLPYGTDPNSLPSKWQCSSLDWLPGMNSCAISEEETTNGLHARYAAPVPDVSASNHGIPVPGDTSTGGVHQSQNITYNTQNLSSVGNISTARDAFSLLSHSIGAPVSNSVKKNSQTTIKTRSLNDGGQTALETVSAIKGSLYNSSKLSDLNTEKHKHKHKQKGDSMEKSKKHSKSKSKRENDQDHIGASKKLKKGSLHYADKDCHSKDVLEKTLVENANGKFSTKMTANNQPSYSKFSLAEDSVHDLNGISSALSKKSKDGYVSATDVEKHGNMGLSLKKRKSKEYHENNHDEEDPFPGQNVVDYKVIVKGDPSENDLVNVKKVKVSKSEGKVSKLSRPYTTDKVANLRKAVLPSSGESLPDGVNNEGQYLAGKRYESNACQENARRGSDVEPLKRDTICVQTSTAANSSSSKVSGSHKSKAHLQEAKGSPVESVSSSPVRIPSIEKLSNKKISAQVDDIILGSPKRCSDIKVDRQSERPRKGTDVIVQQKSVEIQRLRDSYLRGKYDNEENDTNPVTDGKSVDPMDQGSKYLHEIEDKNGYQDLDESHTKLHGDSDFRSKKPGRSSSGYKEKPRGSKSVLDAGKIKVSSSYSDNKELHATKNNISSRHEDNVHSEFAETLRKENGNFKEKDEKDFMKKVSLSKCSTGRQDNISSFAIDEHAVSNDRLELPTQHKGSNSRASVGVKSSKENIQEELEVAPSYHKEKAHNRLCSQRTDKQELCSGLESSYINLPSDDKQETNGCGPRVVASVLKESTSEVSAVVGNNEASKVVKQSRQPDIQNGLHHNHLRHATPNGPDMPSPMRKDGHFSVSAVVKEARDLKHMANRLKTEGPEFESTRLYFEAALKFLHAASLMEPSDSTKHDAAQMYSETATLCQYVAHEYERCKEMVGAALAYKCVEVAYLKAAYCKNPTANKDRHELQAVLQMLPPGESPSSSASDVDNLNNHQGTLGKAITTKGVSSPQIAGNHAAAARLHPQVLRLLQFTNDLNFAFEATRKSQIAIAAATVSEKKLDGLPSVRNALDFNFHNVEGLMRLVRIAMEKISR